MVQITKKKFSSHVLGFWNVSNVKNMNIKFIELARKYKKLLSPVSLQYEMPFEFYGPFLKSHISTNFYKFRHQGSIVLYNILKIRIILSSWSNFAM